MTHDSSETGNGRKALLSNLLAAGQSSHYEEATPPSAPGNPTTLTKLRKCVKCGKKHPLTEYGSNKTSSDGLQTYCRLCKNALRVKKNKQDISHRLKHHIAVRVKSQMDNVGGVPEGYVANLEKYLGYKIWELKAALDREIYTREGISLRTALERGYHIDHRRPLSSFVPQNIGDQEFRLCWAISNLWAIPADVNLAKGAKTDFFDSEEAL